eukprot:779321-Prorocentrum_minimum.AAC.1
MPRHLGCLASSTRTARVAVGELPGLKIESGGNAIGGESVNSSGARLGVDNSRHVDKSGMSLSVDRFSYMSLSVD